MKAITISNTRPGFVPFSVRPLMIAGQAPRLAQRPAYRPAPYRPPMLSNPPPAPRLGQGFSLSDVPMSLTFGIAGGAAMVLAGVIPSPAKELATVAGLGLIAFGLLNLFSGPASAAETSVPASGVKPFTPAATNDFNQVTGKIVKPAWNEEVNKGFLSGDYDVEILWYNGSDKTLTVPYRISVEEDPQIGIGSEKFTGVAYTGQISLGPKQSVQVPLEVDLKYRGYSLAVGVTLKLEKVSTSNQIFELDKKFFVVY